MQHSICLHIWQWYVAQQHMQNVLLCFHCKMVTRTRHNTALYVYYFFSIILFLLFSFVYMDSFDITEQVTLLSRFACGRKHVAWRSAGRRYGHVWLVWAGDCVLVCSQVGAPLTVQLKFWSFLSLNLRTKDAPRYRRHDYTINWGEYSKFSSEVDNEMNFDVSNYPSVIR